ncbi:hypothetical protein CUZ56_01801 [Saezia sanguinis]|uniref:PepSY domain-containing protein n=1 Tax=Saezia sanguinis TaxID=1965230 RepID=A0A433SCQ7_9BURK|nr:hypothetical protein [Saezia sanguinis]RUS66521.1 hypothetical protein CUZ56_01801 [Saezia sanguinis]
MKKFWSISLLLFISSLFSAWSYAQSTITQEQAIEIAKQELLNEGGDIEWIGDTIVMFDEECNCWGIIFESKQLPNGGYLIGDHVSAEVSPDGSSVQLRAGY